MFLSRNKKNNLYPCKPQFYYIKVGLNGSKSKRHVFVMCMLHMYILIQLVYFHQDISFGQAKEILYFSDLDLIFKVTVLQMLLDFNQ